MAAVWHSRALLIGLASVAAITAALTIVGNTGFPGAAPVEDIQCFLIVVDLIATAVVAVIFTVVEYVRRAAAQRRARPISTRMSGFAIAGVSLTAFTLMVWIVTGSLGEFIELFGPTRTRYMTHSFGLAIAGIPWVLGMLFGAWGFRPGGHRITNVLALVSVGVGVVLAVISTAAALVYGAGLSD